MPLGRPRQGPPRCAPNGTGYRGWADRFAERLAAGRPGLRYANLAVRGKAIADVVADQVPLAIAMAPHLVSIAAGGNDLLRPRADSSDGHRRVALRACEVVGLSVDEDWREPLPPRPGADESPARTAARPRAAVLAQTAGWLSARRLDARWAREHAVPWFGRRVRGVSSGDGIPPKRPELLPL
jgi:hypothetical protein